MKIVIISYSFTGNNEALAKSIAAEFAAEHIKITESRPRTTGTIILDMLFNRIPQVSPAVDKMADKDLIIFVGPVWMGQAAAPFRTYFKHLKARPGRYAFISISGGAIGTNPKLAGDLKKRAGREPAALVDLHIADLLPSDPKPAMKDTSAYRINESDLKKLTGTIVKKMKEKIPQ